MESETYDRSFYEMQQNDSASSAQKIVPLLMELLNPKSVIDIGCGVGTWTAQFLRNGASTVLGVDGDYVDRKMLHLPQTMFRPFDLAISLEVAEHLPAASATSFIRSLTKSSKFVIFSAAHPGQGGVGHINEQWPSYWASIFEKFGFSAIDLVRPIVWSDTSIQLCYRHNILLFVLDSEVPSHFQVVEDPRTLDIVHPERWNRRKLRDRKGRDEFPINRRQGITGRLRKISDAIASLGNGSSPKSR